MAEVALLVAEEFERGKRWTKRVEAAAEESSKAPYLSVLLRRVEGPSTAAEEAVRGGEVFLRKVLEPRSQLGLAAFDGLFSA